MLNPHQLAAAAQDFLGSDSPPAIPAEFHDAASSLWDRLYLPPPVSGSPALFREFRKFLPRVKTQLKDGFPADHTTTLFYCSSLLFFLNQLLFHCASPGDNCHPQPYLSLPTSDAELRTRDPNALDDFTFEQAESWTTLLRDFSKLDELHTFSAICMVIDATVHAWIHEEAPSNFSKVLAACYEGAFHTAQGHVEDQIYSLLPNTPKPASPDRKIALEKSRDALAELRTQLLNDIEAIKTSQPDLEPRLNETRQAVEEGRCNIQQLQLHHKQLRDLLTAASNSAQDAAEDAAKAVREVQASTQDLQQASRDIRNLQHRDTTNHQDLQTLRSTIDRLDQDIEKLYDAFPPRQRADIENALALLRNPPWCSQAYVNTKLSEVQQSLSTLESNISTAPATPARAQFSPDTARHLQDNIPMVDHLRTELPKLQDRLTAAEARVSTAITSAELCREELANLRNIPLSVSPMAGFATPQLVRPQPGALPEPTVMIQEPTLMSRVLTLEDALAKQLQLNATWTQRFAELEAKLTASNQAATDESARFNLKLAELAVPSIRSEVQTVQQSLTSLSTSVQQHDAKLQLAVAKPADADIKALRDALSQQEADSASSLSSVRDSIQALRQELRAPSASPAPVPPSQSAPPIAPATKSTRQVTSASTAPRPNPSNTFRAASSIPRRETAVVAAHRSEPSLFPSALEKYSTQLSIAPETDWSAAGAKSMYFSNQRAKIDGHPLANLGSANDAQQSQHRNLVELISHGDVRESLFRTFCHFTVRVADFSRTAGKDRETLPSRSASTAPSTLCREDVEYIRTFITELQIETSAAYYTLYGADADQRPKLVLEMWKDNFTNRTPEQMFSYPEQASGAHALAFSKAHRHISSLDDHDAPLAVTESAMRAVLAEHCIVKTLREVFGRLPYSNKTPELRTHLIRRIYAYTCAARLVHPDDAGSVVTFQREYDIAVGRYFFTDSTHECPPSSLYDLSSPFVRGFMF